MEYVMKYNFDEAVERRGTGCLKYDFTDARNVLERSSARETASRVAVGAICKQVLKNFDIDFVSHVIQIGNVKDENVYDFDYIKNNFL